MDGFGPEMFLRCSLERDSNRAAEAFQIEAPTPPDLRRMAELVEQYSDLPLGGTYASIVALAERLGAATIITLDRLHFGSVKPKHVESFKLLP